MGWKRFAGIALAGVCISAPAAPVAAARPPSHQLTSPGCHRALLPPERKINVTAVMRPVSGTTSMTMQFDLQRSKRRNGPYLTVRGRGLAQWMHPPDPTLGQRPGDIWKVDEKVTNLPGPAFYRLRVRYRWAGSRGRSLGTASDTGPVCYEPELRSDLLVRSLTVRPVAGHPSEDRYVAVLGNRGRTGAGPFMVELTLPSQPPQWATVAFVGAHSSVRQDFTGPACTPGSRLTVAVDPDGTILEYDRANNTLTTTCPAPAQTPAATQDRHSGRRYTW